MPNFSTIIILPFTKVIAVGKVKIGEDISILINEQKIIRLNILTYLD